MISRPKSASVYSLTILIVVVSLQLGACGGDDATSPVASEPALVLRPEAELTPGCYDWPTADLMLPDATGYAMPIAAGDRAIDFTLADVEGTKHKLSRLLEARPALIVFGAYT